MCPLSHIIHLCGCVVWVGTAKSVWERGEVDKAARLTERRLRQQWAIVEAAPHQSAIAFAGQIQMMQEVPRTRLRNGKKSIIRCSYCFRRL
jgi:hypothetical protein